MDGFQRHFNSQIIIYGKQVIINLVNHKGSEKALEQAFANMVSSLGSGMTSYSAFDFHKECKNMQWGRLSILLDQVAEMQDKLIYFLVDSAGKVVTNQGVFCSNCMDCLARTNVIQSMLAAVPFRPSCRDWEFCMWDRSLKSKMNLRRFTKMPGLIMLIPVPNSVRELVL